MTDEQFENELRARATRMTNLAIKLYVEAQSLLDMLPVVDDALLAECGESRKVEVTEEMANAIYNLCLQIMKEPIEMYWFCERLSDIINGGDA